MNIFGQLINAQAENKTSNYSAGVAGRIWFNSTLQKFMTDDGTLVRAFLRNDVNFILGNSATVSDNIRINRGASGVLQFLPGGDTTAEGTLSNTLNQISARIENYINTGRPGNGNPGRLIFVTDFEGGTMLVDNGTTWSTLGGGSGTTVANETEFAAAVTAFGISGGGEMIVTQSFSLTTNYAIPTRTIISGKGKSTQITIATGCTLTMGDFSEIRDIALIAGKTTGVLVIVAGSGSTFQGVEFVMVGVNSVTALSMTGSGNHAFRSVFQNVTGTSATGIDYVSGTDNSDNLCIFT